MLELNKIYCVDCLEFMKMLPDKYFDLVITDPPYGLNEDGRKDKARVRPNYKWKNPKASGYSIGGWDSIKLDKKYFDEIFRVSKNQIIFGANHFIESMPKNSSCWIFWDKKTSGDFADGELAWTSFDRAVRKFTWLWSGFKKQKPERRYHPTQKPIALARWLLKNFAKKGDKIFDPFAGSGSFLVACKQLGFDYVGCEINQEYVEISNQRLKQNTLNDNGGTNFTKSSADDFPYQESLIEDKQNPQLFITENIVED